MVVVVVVIVVVEPRDVGAKLRMHARSGHRVTVNTAGTSQYGE